MRTGIRGLAALSLVMTIASSAVAQTIAGRVIDQQTKAPLREVDVMLLADSDVALHPVAYATTDSLGIFYLDAPSAGVYRLRFATAKYTLMTGAVPLGKDEVAQREYLLPTQERTYTEFEVTAQVRPSSNNRRPTYPDALRNANIQGEVLVQVVVDTTGKADMDTFRVLRSTDVLFTNAVRNVLPNYEFEPAMIGNRKVKQLIQMPFHFCLDGGRSPTARPDSSHYWAIPPVRPGVCPSR